MPQANLFVEKREHPRVSVKIPITYYFAEDNLDHIVQWRLQDQNAQALDLSLSGMHIVVDHKLLTGTVIRLDMTLPHKPEPLTLFAEVVWSNENGAGLHFIEMLLDDVEALKTYVTEIGTASK